MIATGALFPIFLRQERDWRVKSRHLLYLFGLALLGTFINRLFWSKGVDLTTASNASLLSMTSPVIFSSLAVVFLAR